MDFVRVGDVVLHAKRVGDPNAPTLVLVNTLGTDLRIWARVVAYLEDQCFVVRYDQRGHGLSTLGCNSPALTRYADDLAGLLDQLDTGPSVVCGLGMGGLVAATMTYLRPDLVIGLCLVSPGLPPPGDAPAADLGAVAEPILEDWFPRPFLDQRGDEVRAWQALLVRTPIAAYQQAQTALANGQAQLGTALAAVRVPSLVLAGGAESPARQATVRALADTIAAEEVRELEGAAHLAPVTHPGPVAAALIAFVERLQRA